MHSTRKRSKSQSSNRALGENESHGIVKHETVPNKTEKSLSSKLRRKLTAESSEVPRPAVPEVEEPAVPDVEDWTPPQWERALENVRQMRARRDAPVDSLGAEVFMNDPSIKDPKVARLHVLVALLLSSQTKDQVTHAAVCRLKEAGLSVPWLCRVQEQELAELVRPVGFWRKKAVYLKAVGAALKNDHDSDIPASLQQLCTLPGVGPKMAHLTMNIAWGNLSGIGVDTHVHRICNRLAWVRRETSSPEATRLAVEAWLPRRLWAEINLLFVGFGQQTCTPVAPRCGECLNFSLCPAAAKSSVSPRKKAKR